MFAKKSRYVEPIPKEPLQLTRCPKRLSFLSIFLSPHILLNRLYVLDNVLRRTPPKIQKPEVLDLSCRGRSAGINNPTVLRCREKPEMAVSCGAPLPPAFVVLEHP
jgi:hypothetical protein